MNDPALRISKLQEKMDQLRESAEAERQVRAREHIFHSIRDEIRGILAEIDNLTRIEGDCQVSLAKFLAQALPKPEKGSYLQNQQESDRKCHPTRIQPWPSMVQEARARFLKPDVQEIARSRSFRLDDNETMTNPNSFIAAEAESNSQLHSFPVRRVNRVLREQPDEWNLVISQQPSTQATVCTDEYARLLSLEGLQPDVPPEKGRGLETVPDFCAVRRRRNISRDIIWGCEGKSPFRLEGVAEYGLVKLLQEVTEHLAGGEDIKTFRRACLNIICVQNAVNCVGQVYKYMSERGLAHGGLSDYYNTWYMFADRQGSLLISEAIPWSQRSDPTCLSATEAMLFSALSAHDEERKGRHIPYPAAGALGKHPEATAAPLPRDEIELSEGDARGGGVNRPAEGAGTTDSALMVTQGDCSIADLRMGLCLARQTYLARRNGEDVVVRMGFTRRQQCRVTAEVAALEALQPLQGLDVPRLLAHGDTYEGYAYAVTEQVQGKQWDQSLHSHRQLAEQLKAALTRIHKYGILHNDVKPENILVEHATCRPVFIDFGLAEPALDEELYELEDDNLRVMLQRAEWHAKGDARGAEQDVQISAHTADAPAVAEIAGRGSRERSIAAAGYAGCRQVIRKAMLHNPHMPMRSATRHKSGVNSIRVQHSHAMIAARL